jgi:hypothetical protein
MFVGHSDTKRERKKKTKPPFLLLYHKSIFRREEKHLIEVANMIEKNIVGIVLPPKKIQQQMIACC